MEATFAEASANDHVARLVAKDFCGGESNVENGAGGRVRDGYCWLRDGYCWAARREPDTAGRAAGSQFRQAARRLDSSTDTFCRRQSVIDSEDETSRAGGRTSRSED